MAVVPFANEHGSCPGLFVTARIRSHGTSSYRILLHPPSSEVSYILAKAHHREEVDEHMAWLKQNLMAKLGALGGCAAIVAKLTALLVFRRLRLRR